jgi:hypothetical protein
MDALSFCLGAVAAVVLGHLSRLKRKGQTSDEPAHDDTAPRFHDSPNPGWLSESRQPTISPYANEEIVTLLPEDVPKPALYSFVISAIVPRPVAFVSSLSSTGARNLAPYSYFGCMGHNPPLVSIAICRSPARGGGKKDTMANIEETRCVARVFKPRLLHSSVHLIFPVLSSVQLASLPAPVAVRVHASTSHSSLTTCSIRQGVHGGTH